MPIYEFHCGKCERDSEILVRSSDWQGAVCPHCGSPKLEKKFSTFASKSDHPAGVSAGRVGDGGGGCGSCGCAPGRPHRH